MKTVDAFICLFVYAFVQQIHELTNQRLNNRLLNNPNKAFSLLGEKNYNRIPYE